ncbi:nucleotidyltransferase family protein [Rhodocyclus purpureus]|uniref:nucleotidyltransferase domain-containing protein n=1 Tax=Rhodocyclus purpureus TaxID=1067 RepID=UPI00191377FA|nr:nucleotidyltransferase family protein [Rhodocyclus purpureus]MBK5913865.1 hypothetical protein [Rhodocyclus purpureus]
MNASADVGLLLRGLHEPLRIDEGRWDRLLRLGRVSGLHARLAATNLDNPALTAVVRRHLLSAQRMAAYRTQMLRAELFRLAPLVTDDFPVIVLKGAAYVLQQRRLSVGRFVSDVDLLVPRPQLRTMESRLLDAGWRAEKLEAYDERYYRDWSHETPPMRYPGSTLELDLHHALTPVTGSLAFDPASLFARSEAIPGTPFRALCAEDQVLHACVHCFHDGELDLRLREVVDIDGLLRAFAEAPGFSARLRQRAAELGLERPLWYGLHFAEAWLGCLPAHELKASLPPPGALARRSMDALVPLSMLPSDPDFPPPMRVAIARTLLRSRYQWLRMPPHLLFPHLLRKSWRRLRARADANGQADGMP